MGAGIFDVSGGALALGLALGLVPGSAARAEPAPTPATTPARAPATRRARARPVEPAIRATWPWALAQLVPSPQWTFPEPGGVLFGMRWQVTPVLFSLRTRAGLSPWRFFVVEPNVRSWGSIELFLSPELVITPGPPERSLLGRVGARLYIPLAHAGDYLSMSGGASAFASWQGAGGAIEVGLYTFAGMFGLQVTHAPDPRARSTTLTLAVRYF